MSEATTDETTDVADTGVGSYVYGIVAAGVRLPDDLAVIPYDGGGDGIGLVTAGDVAAVVSDVRTDRPLGTRADLTAHEQALNALTAVTTVLPMRFGAVVADDDAVAEELLEPHQDYFLRSLEQMRGLAALGVAHVHGFVPRVAELEPLRLLGREVIPAAAKL